MAALRGRLAPIEERRLRVVFAKLFRAAAHGLARHGARKRGESFAKARLKRTTAAQRVGIVRHRAPINCPPVKSVAMT